MAGAEASAVRRRRAGGDAERLDEALHVADEALHVAAVDHLHHDAAELLDSIETAGEAQAAVGGEGHGHERAAGWIGRQASA